MPLVSKTDHSCSFPVSALRQCAWSRMAPAGDYTDAQTGDICLSQVEKVG